MSTTTSKSVKLFNLEDRKNSAGFVTEIDIFQWKNTLLDNLKRESDYVEHCTETSTWGKENIKDRGFTDEEEGDGTARVRADQVTSMLTKIAAYAPKSIVREITRRSTKLEDIWNVCRDWAGIRSSGTKHLDYYKTKKSYQKLDKDESPQEFYYRLRDSMEDTLVQKTDEIYENGIKIRENETMTPTINSLVVLDWLEAIGGPPLIEHTYRVYATELETATLSSLQSRIWKNLPALLHEIEETGDIQRISRTETKPDGKCRQVVNVRNKNTKNEKNYTQSRFQKPKRRYYQAETQNRKGFFCKLCKASGSQSFRSHDISECWLLSDADRNAITKASAKANALFAFEEEDSSQEESEESTSEEES